MSAPPPSANEQLHRAGPEEGAPIDASRAEREFTRPEDDQPRESGKGRESRERFERFGGRTENFVDSVESAIHLTVPRKVRARRDPRHNTVVNVLWRALVLVAGFGLIGLGILLLVLPGPGWALILLGLVVLASEYTWANRLLAPVRRRVKAEAARVRTLGRGQKVALAAVTVTLFVVVLGASVWYVATYGWTLPWS